MQRTHNKNNKTKQNKTNKKKKREKKVWIRTAQSIGPHVDLLTLVRRKVNGKALSQEAPT